MAAITFISNLNMNRNQILNMKIQNIMEDDVIDPVLGQLIFDPQDEKLKFFDGIVWNVSNARFPDRLIYRGAVPHTYNPVDYKTGDLYAFTSGGIAINFGSIEVQIGDYVFYNEDSDSWVGIQGNVVPATISNPGVVKIATNQEVLDGLDNESVVVPKYLWNWEHQTDKELRRKRVFENQTVDNTGLDLYHHIGKNNVAVDVYDQTGQKIYLDITKDINMVTLRSNIQINGLKIIISG